MVLQDVKANSSVRVDIGVVNTSGEITLWGFEGIISREVDVQEVHTTRVGRFVRAHDGSLPVELVLLVDGAG